MERFRESVIKEQTKEFVNGYLEKYYNGKDNYPIFVVEGLKLANLSDEK